MFKASIVEAAVRSCGQKVVSACKTALVDTSGQGGCLAEKGSQKGCSFGTQVWEEFWEAMEKDFQSASRKFWKIDSIRESRAWLRLCAAWEGNC